MAPLVGNVGDKLSHYLSELAEIGEYIFIEKTVNQILLSFFSEKKTSSITISLFHSLIYLLAYI